MERKRTGIKGFDEIIKSLWASSMWFDKDYLVNSILKKMVLSKFDHH